MKRHSSKLNFAGLLVIGTALLAGCGGGSQQALEQVTMQLAWVPTIEYAGFYLAADSGYYQDEGLDVTFVNGGFDDAGAIDPIARVVAGDATFGVAPADSLLIARAQGAPVVGIATIYQRSPIAFVSLAENNIVRAEDFVGATVFVDSEVGSAGIAYRALLASEEVDASQINEIPRDDFGIEPLTSGRVDVMSVFITNQPVQLERAGYEINSILASDYGIELYANVIFVTEEALAESPELITRFLRASLNGLADAVADPDRAAEVTVTQNADLDLESETESMRRSLPLIQPAGSQPGMMTASEWEIAFQILRDQGLVPSDLNVRDAYTLDFLNLAYGE